MARDGRAVTRDYVDNLVWIWKHQLYVKDTAMPAAAAVPRRPSTTRSSHDNARTPHPPRPATTAGTTRTQPQPEPAHKKKAVGKDLSFYLDYVISNLPLGGQEGGCSDSQHQHQLLGLTAARLLGKLSEVLQTRSPQYAQTFQPLLPPGPEPGLKVELRGGQRHLDVKVLLKRPLYPDMFEVQTGHLHGVPPGCALYKVRRCQSKEQDRVVRRMWRCCTDTNGYVSPLKVYPWLAKAVVDAVVYLRERDPQWADLDFRLHATFPVIRIEVTFKQKPSTSRHHQTTTAHSNPATTGNRTMSAHSNPATTGQRAMSAHSNPATTGNHTMSAHSNPATTGNRTMSAHSNRPTIANSVSLTGNRAMSAHSDHVTPGQRPVSGRSNQVTTVQRPVSGRSNHSVGAHGDEEPQPWDNQTNIEISKLSQQTLSVTDSQRLPASRATSARSSVYVDLRISTRNSARNSARCSARCSASGRRSPHSLVSSRPSSAWTFLFNDEEEEEGVEAPAPGTLYLNLIPTIEGFSWPQGVRMPQVLPNQRPWSVKAQRWAADLRERLTDGDSFWELTAFDPVSVLSQPGYLPYWRISYRATHHYLLSRVAAELAFSSTLDGVLDVVEMAAADSGKVWAILGSEVRDEIRMCAMRENLHRGRSLGEWYLAVLGATIQALQALQQLKGHPGTATRPAGDQEDGSPSSGTGDEGAPLLDAGDEEARLLQALQQVEALSHEDPRKLVERIQLNDPAADDDLDLAVRPPPDKVIKSSTPVVARRASMTTIDKPLVVSRPVKQPQRNLYRLFRKDL